MFLLRYWKPATAVLLLLAIGAWHLHAVRSARLSGRAEVQVEWDQWSAGNEAQKAADDATNRRLNADREATNDKERKRIADDRDDLAGRLQRTEGHYRAISAAYREFQADEAGRIARSEAGFARRLEEIRGRLEGARADVVAGTKRLDHACQLDALTLTDLQAEVRPWVRQE
jgi:hypothetical protein